MPRLSIIVPHREDDARLEMTLLSLLENRPEECEIIVVHDGSYANPYQLQDEVIFVEAETGASRLHLLNAGVMAACSPAVCILLDGAVVNAGWSASPLETLLNTQCGAVAVCIDYPRAAKSARGISERLLGRPDCVQAGRLEATGTDGCMGPLLACGFYRRKVLLALGGWNEALEESVADVELAFALSALGIRCEFDPRVGVSLDCGSLTRRLSAVARAQLASLFVAHGAVVPGWGPALTNFLSGCLKGHLLAAAAWSAGLRDASAIRQTQLRLDRARQQLANTTDNSWLRVFEGQPAASGRRAA